MCKSMMQNVDTLWRPKVPHSMYCFAIAKEKDVPSAFLEYWWLAWILNKDNWGLHNKGRHIIDDGLVVIIFEIGLFLVGLNFKIQKGP